MIKRKLPKNVELTDGWFISYGPAKESQTAWGGKYTTLIFKTDIGRAYVYVAGNMDNFEEWETWLINNQSNHSFKWQIAIKQGKDGKHLRSKDGTLIGHGDYIPKYQANGVKSHIPQFTNLFE
jgi:hypothetical protein